MTPAEIEKVFDWYSTDQPQNATFQREIHRWSTFCQDLKDKPSSLLVAFILADSDYYPNIDEIFQNINGLALLHIQRIKKSLKILKG
jgi:hypothetical protein